MAYMECLGNDFIDEQPFVHWYPGAAWHMGLCLLG